MPPTGAARSSCTPTVNASTRPWPGYESAPGSSNTPGSAFARLLPPTARRLGHILGDRIQETYSHVAAEVDTRLLEGLQDRCVKAVADSPAQPAGREAVT